MDSGLFLRETGRRLRAATREIETRYIRRRYRWMAAFRDLDDGALDLIVEALAASVETNDIERYAEYAGTAVLDMLDRGTVPIVLLAAGELFESAVQACLTPDQQRVVERFFVAARERRQTMMRHWMLEAEAAGA